MRPVLCLVTDRRRVGGDWRVILPRRAEAAARAGVDLVQIRETDLEGGPLFALARDCVSAVSNTSTRVLINERLDVALAASAHGVHLRGNSFAAERIRSVVPGRLLIGRSVHSAAEAANVLDRGGVDYLLFGTVFPSASKPGQQAAGVEALHAVAEPARVPVLAIGGVSLDRVPELAAAGASGIAAIELFAACPDNALRDLVDRIRFLFDSHARLS